MEISVGASYFVRVRIRAGLLGAALVAALASPARAADAPPDDDAERARAGVQERRLVPLESILDWIEARHAGHAIEVELEEEEEGDPPSYEVEWLTPEGQVIEFEFDATSGALLESEVQGVRP
jgi:uncharacterized membrane protein YkoI